MQTDNKISAELISARKLVYDPCNYKFENLRAEDESHEYGACTFSLNECLIKFRAAKITPTKSGQFVTLWKRNKSGITAPHDDTDPIALYVISVRKNDLFGQFVFPKHCLVSHGILSTPGKEGKRGFRVYPAWDKAENKQAQKTQQWQLNFFLEINTGDALDLERVNQLYSK